MPRPLAGVLAVSLLGATIAVAGWIALFSTPAPQRALAATSHVCPTPAAAPRASKAFNAAWARYLTESRGMVIHADLRQIAHDSVLIGALSVGNLNSALAEANRQLVRHVVRIRVLRGAHVLVDANSTSFDVAGSGMQLNAKDGRSLGRLQITVQDVIGFIKLVHKLDVADVVVRGARGHVRTSLKAAAKLSLPLSGCTQIGTHRYVVHSFKETSFTGEPLTIWLLTAAKIGTAQVRHRPRIIDPGGTCAQEGPARPASARSDCRNELVVWSTAAGSYPHRYRECGGRVGDGARLALHLFGSSPRDGSASVPVSVSIDGGIPSRPACLDGGGACPSAEATLA
jgi:hypothetical protein